jgi:hypothetical protein
MQKLFWLITEVKLTNINGIIFAFKAIMKITNQVLILILIFSSLSCNSYKYIHDSDSKKRQHEIQKNRSGNVVSGIFLTLGSAIFGAATGVYVGYTPEGQNFKRLIIKNPSTDTMYVNMLTDVSWDNENYCDFMDIRVPPGKKCKVLVPLDVTYNIYFGNTDHPEKDELLEINTAEIRKITLFPKITLTGDTIIRR